MGQSEKISLQKYIEIHGPMKISESLKCNLNSIYQWKRLEATPNFKSASLLIKLSRGKLDFESIYRPFYNVKFKK